MNLQWIPIGPGREEYLDMDDTRNGRGRMYGAVVDGVGFTVDPHGGHRGEGSKALKQGTGKQFVEDEVETQ